MAQLREFYRDVNRNLKNKSSVRSKWFRRDVGLCTNLITWCNTKRLDINETERLFNRMRQQFLSVGLDKEFPFNNHENNYTSEANEFKIFKNPARLEWIRKHCS